jgi:hypothetical protein
MTQPIDPTPDSSADSSPTDSSANITPVPWSLCWQWSLATALAIALSTALAGNNNSFFNTLPFLVLLLDLLLVALPQALLLRQYVPGWAWWILATVVGGAIALVAGGFALFGIPGGGIVYGIVGGSILGLAQWIVLRRYSAKAYWWILGSAIALTLSASWFVQITLGGIVAAPSTLPQPAWIGLGALSGAIGGAIKGGLLVWLLRHPKK